MKTPKKSNRDAVKRELQNVFLEFLKSDDRKVSKLAKIGRLLTVVGEAFLAARVEYEQHR